MVNYFANKAVGVLTNVPGPRQPMTLAGTQVEGVLGAFQHPAEAFPVTVRILPVEAGLHEQGFKRGHDPGF